MASLSVNVELSAGNFQGSTRNPDQAVVTAAIHTEPDARGALHAVSLVQSDELSRQSLQPACQRKIFRQAAGTGARRSILLHSVHGRKHPRTEASVRLIPAITDHGELVKSH